MNLDQAIRISRTRPLRAGAIDLVFGAIDR